MKPASVSWSSVRAYSTRIPRPRLPEKPYPRVNDPLAQNPTATTTEPAPGLTFVTRPPPTSSTPFSLTTAPASPLLRPATKRTAETQLPPTTRSTKSPGPWVTQAVIRKIRELRTEDPTRFTRTVLARMYGVTQGFVGMVAPSAKTYRKQAIRERDAEHETHREKWGVRKTMTMEIRRKRKEFW